MPFPALVRSRTLLGVVIGYLVFGLSAVVLFRVAGVDPHAPASTGFIIGCTVYGMAFAALGGAIAARIARRGARPALLVAGIIAIGALVSIVGMRGRGAGALWSPIAALVLMAPSAAVGGVWWTRRQRRIASSAVTAPAPAGSRNRAARSARRP